jgi:hypothetical protein
MTVSGSVNVTARDGWANFRGRPRRGTPSTGRGGMDEFLWIIHVRGYFSSKKQTETNQTGESARDSRIDVSDDENHVRRFFAQDLVESPAHDVDLDRFAGVSDLQIPIAQPEPKIPELHSRHAVISVLTRVHEALVDTPGRIQRRHDSAIFMKFGRAPTM